MILKVLIPLVALAGASYATYTVAVGSMPVPVARPVADPAQAPYESYIAGSGLIEAASQNIAIGSPLPRIVAEVFVKVGDEVAADAPLFRLDDRDLRAELAVRKGALASARAKLDRLAAAPRPEELPPAEARVRAAETILADLKNQVTAWEAVADKRAVSEEELARKRFAAQSAEARLSEAQSQLLLLKAGAWKPDVDVARAEVASAEATVGSTETELARLVVRAPLKGVLLQVNIRAGEFAPSGALPTPLLLFGNLDRLHVRVDVDENDAWRWKPGSSATAFVRGNRELRTLLRFDHVEPYVIPKKSLTGDVTERVDTRVMQALYSFDRAALPVFVGQQMDIFIEVKKETPK